MKAVSFVHHHRLRVRYAETDQMGVVYYANYLVWFEIGRVEYCRSIGLHYLEMEKESECFLTVAEAGCRYRQPLTYDSEFVIRTRLTRFRGSFLSFDYSLTDPAGELLYATGFTKHIVTGPGGRPRVVPEPYAGRIRSAWEREG